MLLFKDDYFLFQRESYHSSEVRCESDHFKALHQGLLSTIVVILEYVRQGNLYRCPILLSRNHQQLYCHIAIYTLMIKLNKEAEQRHQKLLTLEEEQQLLQAQLAYTRNQNEKFTKSLEQKNKSIRELEKKYTQTSEESSALKSKEITVKNQYNQMEEQRQELTVRLENLNIAKSKLQQQLRSLESRSVNSKQQLQYFKTKISKKDKQYQQAQTATIELKEKIQRAKNKISEIQGQISIFDKEISALGVILEGGI